MSAAPSRAVLHFSRSRFVAALTGTSLAVAAVLTGGPAMAVGPTPQVATSVYVSPTEATAQLVTARIRFLLCSTPVTTCAPSTPT